jgi:hypothetical protein
MGAFYGSIQVRSNQHDAVVAAVESVARERGIKCLVSPVLNEWVGVYPENHGQDDQFGAAVAEQFGGLVVQMLVHDSDVMAYWLWRDRQLIDSYWSRPGYFGEKDRPKQQEMAGRPQEFRLLIGDKVDRLSEILRRDADDLPPLEEDRLERFAKLLGISNALNAYEYMKEGDAAGRKGWRKFTEVPAVAAIKETNKRREDRNHAKNERRLLEKDGLLLLRDERKEAIPRGCAAAAGFIVAWPDYRAGTASTDFYRDPWQNSTPSGLENPPHINAVVSDASRKRVAMAVGDRIRVWDNNNEDWKVVAEIPEPDLAIGLAISSDGTTVAHSSRQEIVVTQIAQQQTLVRVTAHSTQNMAFHPSGDWIAVSGSTLGLISVQQPHWRDLFVGGRAASASLFGAMVRSQMRNIDVNTLERQQRAAIDAAMAKLQQMFKRSKKAGMSAQQSQEMRRLQEMRPQVEKQAEEWISRIVAIKEGREPPAPPEAKEHVRCAGFSRDGQWLWCGTNAGLRVFRWESVPREPGSVMSQPTWQYVFPGPPASEFSRDVYAIAEEADDDAIVFAGGSGRLYRLNIESGEVRELAKLPGLAGVHGLAMSRDGATLGIASSWTPQMPAGPKDQRHTWDVWSYPRLRRMFVQPT